RFFAGGVDAVESGFGHGRTPAIYRPSLGRRSTGRTSCRRPHIGASATTTSASNFFCEELSLYPRTHCFRRGDVDMTVFCFGERVHPSSSVIASGELMDCAMGPRWLATRAQGSGLFAEEHLEEACRINGLSSPGN